jgi:hypothetical protein
MPTGELRIRLYPGPNFGEPARGLRDAEDSPDGTHLDQEALSLGL